MSKRHHEELLVEWQNRLGLQDWRIKLKHKCKPKKMYLENCAGCTEWNETLKCARIEIIDPEYYGDRIVSFDWEKTLVHELLHLKLSIISSYVSDLQLRYTHQLIDDLARALISAKRSSLNNQNGRV